MSHASPEQTTIGSLTIIQAPNGAVSLQNYPEELSEPLVQSLVASFQERVLDWRPESRELLSQLQTEQPTRLWVLLSPERPQAEPEDGESGPEASPKAAERWEAIWWWEGNIQWIGAELHNHRPDLQVHTWFCEGKLCSRPQGTARPLPFQSHTLSSQTEQRLQELSSDTYKWLKRLAQDARIWSSREEMWLRRWQAPWTGSLKELGSVLPEAWFTNLLWLRVGREESGIIVCPTGPRYWEDLPERSCEKNRQRWLNQPDLLLEPFALDLYRDARTSEYEFSKIRPEPPLLRPLFQNLLASFRERVRNQIPDTQNHILIDRIEESARIWVKLSIKRPEREVESGPLLPKIIPEERAIWDAQWLWEGELQWVKASSSGSESSSHNEPQLQVNTWSFSGTIFAFSKKADLPVPFQRSGLKSQVQPPEHSIARPDSVEYKWPLSASAEHIWLSELARAAQKGEKEEERQWLHRLQKPWPSSLADLWSLLPAAWLSNLLLLSLDSGHTITAYPIEREKWSEPPTLKELGGETREYEAWGQWLRQPFLPEEIEPSGDSPKSPSAREHEKAPSLPVHGEAPQALPTSAADASPLSARLVVALLLIAIAGLGLFLVFFNRPHKQRARAELPQKRQPVLRSLARPGPRQLFRVLPRPAPVFITPERHKELREFTGKYCLLPQLPKAAPKSYMRFLQSWQRQLCQTKRWLLQEDGPFAELRNEMRQSSSIFFSVSCSKTRTLSSRQPRLASEQLRRWYQLLAPNDSLLPYRLVLLVTKIEQVFQPSYPTRLRNKLKKMEKVPVVSRKSLKGLGKEMADYISANRKKYEKAQCLLQWGQKNPNCTYCRHFALSDRNTP